MTPNPLTCSLSTNISKIAETMLEHKIDSIPVLDDGGALIGLVTSSDLLEIFAVNERESVGRPLPFQWQIHAAVRPGMVRTYG